MSDSIQSGLNQSPNETDLREQVRREMQQVGHCSARLAFQLAEIYQAKTYKAWGFKRWEEWIEADSQGGLSRSYAYKLLRMGQVFARDKDAILAAYFRGEVGVAALLEAVVGIERGEIGITHVVEAVKRREPLPQTRAQAEGLRAARVIPASLDVIRKQAYNVARYHLELPDPSETDIWEWIFTDIVGKAEPYEHTLSDGRKVYFWAQDLLEGRIRCKGCGSWDKSLLDPHHVQARSAGGSDGPVVLLCRPCHREIQPKWREWAVEHGYLQQEDGHGAPLTDGQLPG